MFPRKMYISYRGQDMIFDISDDVREVPEIVEEALSDLAIFVDELPEDDAPVTR